MAVSTEDSMQLTRMAYVDEGFRKQNDLATKIIQGREEKGDKLSFSSAVNQVDKPRLAIYKQTAGVPLIGGCSACKDVVFDGRLVVGTAGERHEKLENMFHEHCLNVH